MDAKSANFKSDEDQSSSPSTNAGTGVQFVKILALNFIAFAEDGKRLELQFTARLVWRPLWQRRFLWQSSGGASTGASDWYYVGGSGTSSKTTPSPEMESDRSCNLQLGWYGGHCGRGDFFSKVQAVLRLRRLIGIMLAVQERARKRLPLVFSATCRRHVVSHRGSKRLA
ncbi:hypothetical protein Fot_14711 [Forsythia ovata]|uniref:Uncharacterized protein n=1 Tax=Forsythia ovata TaxID=205694 RepID=A0ABD1W9L8_9LAMI